LTLPSSATFSSFVCGHLSIYLSICPICNSKTKKRIKIKIDINVPQGTNKWKRSMVMVRGRQNTHKIATCLAYMFIYGWQLMCQRLKRRLQTRPDPLLGIVCCRCLRHFGWTAACHVGTRWRHFFLFINAF